MNKLPEQPDTNTDDLVKKNAREQQQPTQKNDLTPARQAPIPQARPRPHKQAPKPRPLAITARKTAPPAHCPKTIPSLRPEMPPQALLAPQPRPRPARVSPVAALSSGSLSSLSCWRRPSISSSSPVLRAAALKKIRPRGRPSRSRRSRRSSAPWRSARASCLGSVKSFRPIWRHSPASPMAARTCVTPS